MREGTFSVRFGDDAYRVDVGAQGEARVNQSGEALRITPLRANTYRVTDGSGSWRVFVSGPPEARQVFVDGEVYELEVDQESRTRAARARSHLELLGAPMPAKVVQVLVSPGQQVHRGDILVKLEAMKMELPIRAPRDAVVKSLHCKEGDLVQPGVRLLELE